MFDISGILEKANDIMTSDEVYNLKESTKNVGNMLKDKFKMTKLKVDDTIEINKEINDNPIYEIITCAYLNYVNNKLFTTFKTYSYNENTFDDNVEKISICNFAVKNFFDENNIDTDELDIFNINTCLVSLNSNLIINEEIKLVSIEEYMTYVMEFVKKCTKPKKRILSSN